MNLFEYVAVALTVAAIAGRIAMFLPRPPKGPYKAI